MIARVMIGMIFVSPNVILGLTLLGGLFAGLFFGFMKEMRKDYEHH